jgi:hypothetical protein
MNEYSFILHARLKSARKIFSPFSGLTLGGYHARRTPGTKAKGTAKIVCPGWGLRVFWADAGACALLWGLAG